MGRRLGQHFLFDPSILDRIADAADLVPTDTVLEIGPGKGTLTRALAARAGRVVCVEADRRLAEALTAEPPAPNVVVVVGDALRVPWPAVDVIAGNIPYQITSPLIERALTPPRPRRIVFLVQREVADRLAARPGEEHYGAMSAGVQLVAGVERLFAVRAGAFRPPPRVESAVVRITPSAERLTADDAEEQRVRELIRVLFQRRRQQIQRSLREVLSKAAEQGAGPIADADAGPGERHSRVAARLESAGIRPVSRPEELSPHDFVTLARLWPTT